MIIAISGYGKSGKNAVAEIAQRLFPDLCFEVFGFSTSLKHIMSILTNVPASDFEDQKVKKDYFINVTTFEKRWRKQLPKYSLIYDEVDPDGYVEDSWISFRVFLQDVGTNCIRNRFPMAWVNALLIKYDAQYLPMGEAGDSPNWLIPDCRFKNEALGVRERGGFVIRVNRPGCKPINNHPSETEMDDYNFDAVINNDGTLQDLELKVFTTLKKII